jgi:poly(A) polymerase
MKGVEQPPQYHPEGDVWIHTLLMLEGLREPSIELALGVLLHDVGKPGTFRIADRIRFDGHVEKGVELGRALLTRLKFPAAVIDSACALIANHMKFRDVPVMRESTLKRFLRLPDFDQHLELHRLDCLSSHGHLDNYDFAREQLAEMPEEVLRPTRLLTGQDLIAAGYRPGPQFGAVLSSVEDAQLEGRIHTRDEALALAQSLFSASPSVS